MDNVTIKMEVEVEDQPEEDWRQLGEGILIKQEADYGDYGSALNWVEDIIAGSSQVGQSSSDVNLGHQFQEGFQPLTSPVKIKVKVEEEAEAEDPNASFAMSMSPDGSQGEDEPPPECSWDCIHAKQNELLKEAVHHLSVRNTLLEDFIQVEFGEKFQEFEIKRRHLLNLGYGKTGRQISGKRNRKSAEIVVLLGQIRKVENENPERESKDRDCSKISEAAEASPPAITSIPASSSDLVVNDPLTSDKLLEQMKTEDSNHQAIYPQHEVTLIADEVANPLTDESLMTSPPQSVVVDLAPPLQSPSTIKRIVAKRRLSEPSIEDESSDEEEEINGLTLPQLLKWEKMQKQRTLAICPVCSETLKMRNMRDHLMTIHKGIKLACVIETCLVEFKTRKKFKKHLLENHFWTEDGYWEIIKFLEEPVLQWLNERCSELVATTMESVIRRKKLEAYMENAKKIVEDRMVSIMSESVATSVSAPVPIPLMQIQTSALNRIGSLQQFNPAVMISSNQLPSLPNAILTPIPGKVSRWEPIKNESSDEDEDIRGLSLRQLEMWQDAGKPRKLAVCQLCNETIKVKNLRDHLLNIHKGIKFTCPVKHCRDRREFKTRSLFKKHLIQKHSRCIKVEDVYSKTIRKLEEPVLHWLDPRCMKYNATTITNAINKRRRRGRWAVANNQNQRPGRSRTPPRRPSPAIPPQSHPTPSLHSQQESQTFPPGFYPSQQPTNSAYSQQFPTGSPKFSP